MFKNSIWTLLLCMCFVKTYSQQSDKISFESQSLFDIAFVNRGESFKQNLFSSYSLKFEYAGKSWSKNNWSVFIPIGVSYMHLTNKYTSYYLEQLHTSIYHDVNLYFGPQLQYQSKKIRSCLGVFLNSFLNIHTQTNESMLVSNTTHYSSNNFTGSGGFMSARLFCLYKVGKKVWAGPSCEIFFFDFPYAYDELVQRKNSNYKKASLFGISGSSVWINPGLKLQIDLY